MTIEKKALSLVVNGKKVGPVEVPIDLPMIEFLQEYLNLTGTRFGCGQGVCHACTVIQIEADGSKSKTRTCIYGAHMFAGKEIITVEGHANLDDAGELATLSPIQQAFVDNFSFQCSYCTPGFVAGATVLIDQLQRNPVKKENLEAAITAGMDEHICRCTGYVRYYEAIREVALSTPGCVIE